MNELFKDGKLVMEQQVTMSFSNALVIGSALAVAIFIGVMAATWAKKIL